MPALTRAADHSKLWVAVAATMAMSGSRSARRGAGRGLVSLAVASAVTNQLAKRVWPRQRPRYESVSLARRATESRHHIPCPRPLGQRCGVRHRRRTGKPDAGAVACRAGGSSRVLARRDRRALPRRRIGGLRNRVGDRCARRASGPPDRRKAFFDNRSPARRHDAAAHRRRRGRGCQPLRRQRHRGTRDRPGSRELPEADIVTLSADDDIQEVLRAAVQRAEVLGIGGGDGTVAGRGGRGGRRGPTAGRVPGRHVQPLRQGHRL